MKLIAYYLPQFHTIPENDEWWGKGFTEWSNVKKAKPLYEGHLQPRVPLNDNYYDLSEIETIEWQTRLLDEYNVYGLCYYHYWFGGKRLLEKPAEMLLANKQINQRFCFCWANADWRKTWIKENTILQKQEYGDEDEWEAHLNYLLPFFLDDRYIKIDGKPVFVILNMLTIPNAEKRFKYYDDFCKTHGFNGIELIQSINTRKQRPLCFVKSVTYREPSITHYSINSKLKTAINIFRKNKKYNIFKKPVFYKWQKIANESLKYLSEVKPSIKTYAGVFKEWDSTSRHGNHGFVISKPSVNEFESYLQRLKEAIESDSNYSEFVFFTAWNEWCECCYLEPDNENEYGFLRAVKKVCEND